MVGYWDLMRRSSDTCPQQGWLQVHNIYSYLSTPYHVLVFVPLLEIKTSLVLVFVLVFGPQGLDNFTSTFDFIRVNQKNANMWLVVCLAICVVELRSAKG